MKWQRLWLFICSTIIQIQGIYIHIQQKYVHIQGVIFIVKDFFIQT